MICFTSLAHFFISSSHISCFHLVFSLFSLSVLFHLILSTLFWTCFAFLISFHLHLSLISLVLYSSIHLIQPHFMSSSLFILISFNLVSSQSVLFVLPCIISSLTYFISFFKLSFHIISFHVSYLQSCKVTKYTYTVLK